jgi:citrate lyase subunit beta / citryl-CoA lyase
MIERSYLFVPGNRPERFSKAFAATPDAVILDLEDAVPAQDKAAGRENVCAFLQGQERAWVRVNPVDSPHHAEDLRALRGLPGLVGIMLPKAESAEDVAILGVAVIALVETVRGLANARTLAASAALQRIAFGHLDFITDSGVTHAGALDAVMLELVLASRLARKPAPVAGVTTDVKNNATCRADLAHSKALGFGAKLCVHPSQVALTREAYAPTADELSWAREVLAAESQGVALVRGQMVDGPVFHRARAMLA